MDIRRQGIFHLNQFKLNNVLFQESIFSALVITLYVITNDVIKKYVNRDHMKTWKKYLIIFISMFISTIFAIYILLVLFGYKSQYK